MSVEPTASTTLAGDTIAAIATAPGRGGIGIVRVSGPAVTDIAEQVCRQTLQPRQAHFASFYAGPGETSIDQGIALYFPGPNSFTGEDVLELQGHGGPVVMDMLLKACCDAGARPARPGEFSERAFLNDKIDLAQAEAIADLIDASTSAAARSANLSLQGAFSREIDRLLELVIGLRVYVEAAIDFPEEEVDFLSDGKVASRLREIIEQLQLTLASATQGNLLHSGMKLVIAGKPNAGKSSLLNQLSGQDTAIVTPIEGTTRDLLREQIQIDGLPLHIVDTAGLRDNAELVEQEGIRRAWAEMTTADHILVITDPQQDGAANPVLEEIKATIDPLPPLTVVHNKCDLRGVDPSIEATAAGAIINLSAKTGAGIKLLREHLKQVAGYVPGDSNPFSARRRHLQALEDAMTSLEQGEEQLLNDGAGELLAEDLRQCQQHLGEITGSFSSDDLLGEIFSSFCIGK